MRKKFDSPAPLSLNLAFDSRLLNIVYQKIPKQEQLTKPSTLRTSQIRTKSNSRRNSIKKKSKSVSKIGEKIDLAKGLDQQSNKLLVASIRKNILSLDFSNEHSELIQTAYTKLKNKIKKQIPIRISQK